MSPPLPPDEPERLAALRRTNVLDTEPEEVFDRLTRLASAILGTPIALVSLVDEDRQWFKSVVGLEVRETSRDVAFCAFAITDSEVMVVPDAKLDDRFAQNPLVQDDPRIRFYAGAPLTTTSGHNLGTLCVIDTEPRVLSGREKEVLADLAALVTRELELRMVAGTDQLTGAVSREQFHRIGVQEFSRARRHGQSLSVAMVDIDHFKQINDEYGHARGDEMLATLAQCCTTVMRCEETLGRLGGDEFGIIFVGTTATEAHQAMERILAAVQYQTNAETCGHISLSLSAGIAEQKPDDTCFDDILARADERLYAAKTAGRGQVML